MKSIIDEVRLNIDTSFSLEKDEILKNNIKKQLMN